MTNAVGVMSMSEQIFDTLQCANKLKSVGVPEKQAEAFAEVMAETIDAKLATKRDLEKIKVDLDLKIELLRKDIKELELRMTIKLGSFVMGGMGTLVVLMKLLKL
ncbi:conserved hypothetical protein [Gammaproteobacteria bacterium]